MGAHDFKYMKVPRFALKSVVLSIYTLMSLPSFIMIGRDSDGGSYPQT